MLLHFRQGIVEAQIPTFLQVTYPHVDLIVTDTNCTITFAGGTKDYLFTEQQSVAKAWGPLHLGVDQWLYWDLDVRTGNRTFGITTREPIVSPTPPATINDQHWYNTTTNEMYVWIGTSWVKKIRVFACKLVQGRNPVSVSVNSPSFIGTQSGVEGPVYSGHILYDATTNNAIKDAVGNFMTTEDRLTTKTISLSQVKLASIVIEAEAQQNIAAHTIVKFSEFGKIVHADKFIANRPAQFGIVEQSVVVGQVVNVVTQGLISSDSFDFSSHGVNKLLYCDDTGQMVPDPLIPNQVPVAVVLDKKTIQLGVAMPVNSASSGKIGLASNENYGITRLSYPPSDEQDPIAVSDNDPRFQQYIARTGDTMVGDLFLTNDPTSPMHAATKQYVDDNQPTPANQTAPGLVTVSVNPADPANPVVVGDNDPRFQQYVIRTGDTMSGDLTLFKHPTSPMHAATKQYVDLAKTPPAGYQHNVQLNDNGTFGASDRLSFVAGPASVLSIGQSGDTTASLRSPLSTSSLTFSGSGARMESMGNAVLATNDTDRLTITALGEWYINQTPGMVGHVLTSAGANHTPTWAQLPPSPYDVYGGWVGNLPEGSEIVQVLKFTSPRTLLFSAANQTSLYWKIERDVSAQLGNNIDRFYLDVSVNNTGVGYVEFSFLEDVTTVTTSLQDINMNPGDTLYVRTRQHDLTDHNLRNLSFTLYGHIN